MDEEPRAGADYRALDIAAFSNARAASIVDLAPPLGAPSPEMVPAPVGRQSFRGLPFLIGHVAQQRHGSNVFLPRLESQRVRFSER